MNLEEKDYLAEAMSRITWQFKDSSNIETLMRIWLGGYQEIQKVLLEMQLINDVDIATGAQLEVIGDIVGQPRELVNVNSTGFFGFESDSGAKPFGSTSNGAGGLYYSIYDPASGNIQLSDGLYKLFIKAKIRNNNTGGSPEDIIAAAKDIFQTDTVELLEGDYADIYLYIGRPWNDDSLTVFPGLDETAIAARLLPIPAGVQINYEDLSTLGSLRAAQGFSTASDELYYTANTVFPNNIPD